MYNLPATFEYKFICWDCYCDIFLDPTDRTFGRGEWNISILNFDKQEICYYCHNPALVLSNMEDIV